MRKMWQFKTKNFAVTWYVSECYDLDLSFDDTGEVSEKLKSGEFTAFDSEMRVTYRGETIAQDYLGGSIYDNVSDFRDHIGRNAIPLLQRAKRELDKVKGDYRKRIAYCQEKRNSGQWSLACYIRSTEQARKDLRQARAEYTHTKRIADNGGYGSYFSDMVRSAISEAREVLRNRTLPHIRAA